MHTSANRLPRRVNPSGLSSRTDLDSLRSLVVDPFALFDQRVPTAFAHVLNDCPHLGQQRGIAPSGWTCDGGAAAGFTEVIPLEPLHHSIIFSIGMTRIAEAPAALSRSRVSQNTDSWHTACTAT